MTTFALVRNGIVLSHFATDRPAADFPDIEALLVVAPDDIVDGMMYDGQNFFMPPPSRDALLAQILELETRQARAVREALLSGDASRLKSIDADIAAIREKLP